MCINLIIFVFFAIFFLSQIPWFSVYFLQGLSPNHIIPCTKPMVQIPAGFFSYERATRLFFLFHVLPAQTHDWSSYFCKLRPASISLWIPTFGTDISTDIPVAHDTYHSILAETVNIEQRNSQAVSAVVTAVGPVVVAAVGFSVAGRYLYQGWNDTPRA